MESSPAMRHLNHDVRLQDPMARHDAVWNSPLFVVRLKRPGV